MKKKKESKKTRDELSKEAKLLGVKHNSKTNKSALVDGIAEASKQPTTAGELNNPANRTEEPPLAK